MRRGACGACRASRRALEHRLVVAVDIVCLLVAADLVVLEVLVHLRLPLRPCTRRLRLLVLVGGRVAHVTLCAARQQWVSVEEACRAGGGCGTSRRSASSACASDAGMAHIVALSSRRTSQGRSCHSCHSDERAAKVSQLSQLSQLSLGRRLPLATHRPGGASPAPLAPSSGPPRPPSGSRGRAHWEAPTFPLGAFDAPTGSFASSQWEFQNPSGNPSGNSQWEFQSAPRKASGRTGGAARGGQGGGSPGEAALTGSHSEARVGAAPLLDPRHFLCGTFLWVEFGQEVDF